MLQTDITISLLFWAALYFGYLFLQSWVIVGIFLSAEGSTEVLPSGREKDSGMILYPIFKWLHRTKKVQYDFQGEQLANLLTALTKDGLLPAGWTPNLGRISWMEAGMEQAFVAGYADLIRAKYAVLIDTYGDGIGFYKEREEPVLPSVLRKPILGCVRCMPSFWSLFTYALPMWLSFGLKWWWLALWPFTVLALVFLNTLNYRKTK